MIRLLPTAALAAGLLINTALAHELTLVAIPTADGVAVELLESHREVLKARPLFDESEKRALETLGAKRLSQARLIELKSGDSRETLRNWIQSRHLPIRLEENTRFELDMAAARTLSDSGSSDPLVDQQWGLENSGAPQPVDIDSFTRVPIPGIPGEDTGASRAPQERADGKKVIVAILDTGIDLDHPDLSSQIHRKPEECSALRQYETCLSDAKGKPEETRACDQKWAHHDADQNGYPLDCSGWNVVGRKNALTDILGDPNVDDDVGHGTHVAGIIGAESNGLGVQGIAQEVELLPIKVIRGNPNEPVQPKSLELPPNGEIPLPHEKDLEWDYGFADILARGMLYAIRSKAQVINMSLSWPAGADSLLMREMVALAQKQGIIVVASAGNDGNDARTYPCLYDDVVCVASHGPDGAFSHFTNFGSFVDLAAPGLRILSTWPLSKEAKIFTEKKGYEYKNGTSMSAPFVTGAMARLLQTGFTPEEAVARLLLSTRPVRKTEMRSDLQPQRRIRFGNLDLGAAYGVKPQPLILPPKKNLIELVWDGKTRELPFSFDLINRWKQGEEIRIQAWISSELGTSTETQLSTTLFQEPLWPEGELKQFHSTLVLPESNFEGKLNLELTIFSRGNSEHSIQIPIELITAVGPGVQAADWEIFPVIGEEISPQATIRTILNSGVESDTKSAGQHYLAFEERGPEWRIQLIEELDGAYHVSPPTQVSLSRGKLLRVVRANVDLQGPPEIVLIAESLGQPPSRTSNIVFKYFDENLQSLADRGLPDLVYANDVSELSERFQWMRLNVAGKPRLVPAWISVGTTPPLDQPGFDPWDPNPQDFRYLRFFYLSPEGVREIDAGKETIFVHTLAQSRAQEEAGQVPVLLAAGSDYLRQYFTAIVEDGKLGALNELRVEPYRMLVGTFDLQEMLNLKSGKATGTALSSRGFRGALETTLISNGVASGETDQPLSLPDAIMQVAGVFHGEFAGQERTAIFSQMFYDLLYRDLKTGQAAALSLNRFSFIPGMVFSNTFFPVIAGHQSERVPGIFTFADLGATDTVEVIVPLYSESGDLIRLIRPAKTRLRPAKGCQSLGNPLVATEAHPTRVSFLCPGTIIRVPLSW